MIKITIKQLKVFIIVTVFCFFSVTAFSIPAHGSDPPDIGFLGCSVTHNAVTGYKDAGGSDMWDVKPGIYNGGCIFEWFKQLNEPPAEGKKDYWKTFRDYIDQNPGTTRIWWELCSCPEVGGMNYGMKYEDVVDVMEKIETIAPDIKIFATPMPLFPDSTDRLCMENQTPAKLRKFVRWMVDENLVEEGPILSPLNDGQTTRDGCHANEAGREIWGRELMDFFE